MSDDGRNPRGQCASGHRYYRGGCPDCASDMVTEDLVDRDLWLTRAADVKVGDVITTLFSDNGEAKVVALHRVPALNRPGELICAELDNGRHTHLGGDDDIVEVVKR